MWKPLTAVIVWGLSFIATKSALKELTPVTIINIRLLIAIPFLGALLLFSGRSLKLSGRQASLISVLAMISVLHLMIQVTGLKYTSAANTGWIIGTTPVFIAILGRVFFRERISLLKSSGVVLSLLGLLLLISKGRLDSIEFIKSKGDLLILLSCVTWGFYSIVNRKISLDYPPVSSTFYLFVMMAVITLPFNLTDSSFSSIKNLSAGGWMAVLFLGVFCSAIGYALWAKALSEIKSVNAAAFLYLEPFVTLIGAVLLLGETAGMMVLLSGVIIMTGVAVVNFSPD